MRVCCCTLPQTNPKACETCTNNIEFDYENNRGYQINKYPKFEEWIKRLFEIEVPNYKTEILGEFITTDHT